MGAVELNEEQKKQLLAKQKDELKEVIREMISMHHGEGEKIVTEMSKNKEGGTQIGQGDSQEGVAKKKNIHWILDQCMRYDKKFNGKKLSPLKSLQVSKKSQQSIGN